MYFLVKPNHTPICESSSHAVGNAKLGSYPKYNMAYVFPFGN